MKNNIALITGGLGFIGSNLAKQLIKRKIVDKCILLDVFAGYVNPTKNNFQDYRKFRNLDYLIIDRLWYKNHSAHFNLKQVLEFVKIILP